MTSYIPLNIEFTPLDPGEYRDRGLGRPVHYRCRDCLDIHVVASVDDVVDCGVGRPLIAFTRNLASPI